MCPASTNLALVLRCFFVEPPILFVYQLSPTRIAFALPIARRDSVDQGSDCTSFFGALAKFRREITSRVWKRDACDAVR